MWATHEESSSNASSQRSKYKAFGLVWVLANSKSVMISRVLHRYLFVVIIKLLSFFLKICDLPGMFVFIPMSVWYNI